MSFKVLATHHDEISESLFHTMVNDKNHRLYKLLPAPHESTNSLRRARPLNMPGFKTDRFKNSFIIFSCLKQLTYRLEFSNFPACISITFFSTSSVISFFIPFLKLR